MGLIPAHAGKTAVRVRHLQVRRAHPRYYDDPRDAGGSSPLTRGKRLTRSPSGPKPGLIPAHAGKTSSPSAPRPSTAAHPRSRGENLARPDRTG